jgi:hypothetical protein
MVSASLPTLFVRTVGEAAAQAIQFDGARAAAE